MLHENILPQEIELPTLSANLKFIITIVSACILNKLEYIQPSDYLHYLMTHMYLKYNGLTTKRNDER